MGEDTRAEAGCLYYGWTIKEDGSKLFCRETYVDGAAAGHHLSCVAKSGALGEALEKGYIALDNIDLMGTESDIAGQDRVPRPEGGLADVQEDRRRIRRHLLGPLRQLLQVQDVNLTRKEATARFSMTRKKYQSR